MDFVIKQSVEGKVTAELIVTALDRPPALQGDALQAALHRLILHIRIELRVLARGL